jgi:hypothetical protein
MSQPQNPLNPNCVFGSNDNPLGLDIFKIVGPGGSVVYRLSQFQASWWTGMGSPGTIIGALPGNLYIDISSGDIWLLGLNGSWTLLPSGGGGGSVTFSNNETPSGSIDGVNTTFILANTPKTNGLFQLFRSDLLQISGVDYTLVGTTISYSYAPSIGDTLRAFYNY